MSLLITLNGSNYIIPETNEVGWGSNLDDYFVAIAAGVLQKTGGSFTLSAETDFGASFGLKSLYLKSRSSNVSSTGIVRLANNGDAISWRNFANGADLALLVNASNQLTFNGTALQSSALTSAHLFVGSAGGVATDVAVTGDIGITNGGVTSISSGVIVNADVNASAAIAYSKLSLTDSILNADINSAAAIAYSKLNLSGSILNADVNAAAAIAYSKLNLATSIVNADINGSAAIAYSKLNLATSIVNADIAVGAAIARSKIASGTADHVIINDGAGALSSVAQLTVAKGGTGVASFTAYSVLAAGTTSTGALQEISVGLSGQVLTSNGPGALPTMQNVAGTGTVNSGTAGRLSLYATSTSAVSDTYVQNSQNINVTIAAHAALAATRTYTIPEAGASASFVMTQGSQTIVGATTLSSALTITPTTNQLVLGATRTVTLTAPTPATTSRVWTIPDITADGTFAALEGTQTFSGGKTFSSAASFAAGSLATPGINFGSASDSGSGLRRSAAGTVRIVCAGTDTIIFSATEMIPLFQFHSNEAGTVTNTTYGWNGATNDGLYLIAAGNPALAAGGTKAIDIKATGVAIKGTTTNNSAAAGYVGEVIESTVANGTLPTTTQNGDMTSISLTAGDWLVTAIGYFLLGSTTATVLSTWIGTVSGNNTTGLVQGVNSAVMTPDTTGTALGTKSIAVPNYHVQLSATTTYYLKVGATYTGVASNVFQGRITAVRIR